MVFDGPFKVFLKESQHCHTLPGRRTLAAFWNCAASLHDFLTLAFGMFGKIVWMLLFALEVVWLLSATSLVASSYLGVWTWLFVCLFFIEKPFNVVLSLGCYLSNELVLSQAGVLDMLGHALRAQLLLIAARGCNLIVQNATIAVDFFTPALSEALNSFLTKLHFVYHSALTVELRAAITCHSCCYDVLRFSLAKFSLL